MSQRKVISGIGRQRLILRSMFGVIIGISILLIVSTILNVRNARNHVFSTLINRGSALSLSLRMGNRFFSDPFTLGLMVESLVSEEGDVVFIAVLDNRNQVLIQGGPPPKDGLVINADSWSVLRSGQGIQRIVRSQNGLEVLEVIQPLYFDDLNERLGMMGRASFPILSVGIDTSKWNGALRQAYFQAGLIVLSLFILVGVFLYLLNITNNYFDLSQRASEMQEEVERSKRLAAIGSLAAGVAHEIKNPLGSVMGFIEILDEERDEVSDAQSGSDSRSESDAQSDPDSPSSEKHRYFKIITKELRRLDTIVNDLLTFSRQKPPQKRPTDIAYLIDEVLSTSLDKRYENIDVRVTHQDGLEALNIDPDQMKQVLINLLFNAGQALDGSPNPRVEVNTREADGWLLIEIGDNGRGIGADDLPQIFNPFFTTKAKGTGLGLAIAHQIVENHGGNITPSTRLGEGTIFRIKIPFARGTQN